MQDLIKYEDFSKLDLRMATVIAATIVEGADKLLKLSLDVGDPLSGGLGERIVVSGIRQWYQPEDLVGKQVIYLANLEPKILRGVESQGMVLAAIEDGQAVLLGPEKLVSNGGKIC